MASESKPGNTGKMTAHKKVVIPSRAREKFFES
jgi:hypothetical protein